MATNQLLVRFMTIIKNRDGENATPPRVVSTNSSAKSFTVAIQDLINGLARYHIWLMLGWQDIKQRYRRSVLGPFWLTLSTAIIVTGMGPLYGRLFGQSTLDYWPYLAVSIVLWGLMATIIAECCQVFTGSEGIIKQLRLPLSLHIYRLIWRNLIILGHNMLFVVPVLIFLGPGLNMSWLLIPMGLLLYILNATWLSLVLGVLCARFRDIPVIVTTVIQLLFLMTPVFWKPEMLGDRAWVANVNPMFHMLEIIRAPLLGTTGSALSWLVAVGLTIFGFIAALLLFAKYRARISYWL